MSPSCTREQDNKRNTSVDAFRCLLMLLIVMHHSASHGLYGAGGSGWLTPVFLTVLTYWHVDGFIAISGWYGVRFSLVKFSCLYGVVAFWSAMKLLAKWVIGFSDNFGQIWSGGWFGDTYLAFCFIAPLLNASVDRMLSMERRRMIVIWIVFNVGMILNWAPHHFLTGVCASGGGAFSILTFENIYVNVRLLRETGLHKKFSARFFVVCVLAFLGGVCLFSLPFAVPEYLRTGVCTLAGWVGYTTYNSPHSIVIAVALLLLFVKFVYIPAWLSRVTSAIAPFMFGVYVIHEGTFVGRKLFVIVQEKILTFVNMHEFFVVLLSAFIVFILCLGFEGLRHFAVLPLKRFVLPYLRQLDTKFLDKH